MPTFPKKLDDLKGTEKNWVETSINSLRSYYDEAHKQTHHLRRMRFMRLRARAPRAFQRVIGQGLRSPLSYTLGQTVSGMVAKNRPRFTRVPRTASEKDSAGRLQRSADPMLQMFDRIARKPLYWQYIDALVNDARAHTKVVRVPWRGFPVRGDFENDAEYNKSVGKFVMSGSDHPLRMKLVDTLNILIPPTEYGDPPFTIEQGRRPLLSTMNALGLNFGVNKRIIQMPEGKAFPNLELPRGLPVSVDVEEFWTDDVVFVRIAGEMYKFQNDLGFVPYTHVMGMVSSNPDPTVEALSVLFPYQGIEPWLNTLLSTMAAWSILGSVPILWTSRRPFTGAPAPDTMPTLSEMPLGKRIDLGTGGEMGFAQPPAIGQAVLEFIEVLVQFLDRSGVTPLASGIMGTRTPGTAFSGAIEAAMSKLAPLIDNAETGLADTVKVAWRIVDDVIKQPIWVTGEGLEARPLALGRRKARGRYVIDPKDIDGYYDVSAKIRVVSLQDRISRGMHAAFMKAHKLWTRERAMEFSGVDDPWDEFVGTLTNQLEESPFVTQQILKNALQTDPELAQRAAELEAQGLDLGELLTGQASGPIGGGGGGGEGTFGGAPQPRGGQAGGRPTGSPRRPGGRRGGRGQGSQFPK